MPVRVNLHLREQFRERPSKPRRQRPGQARAPFGGREPALGCAGIFAHVRAAFDSVWYSRFVHSQWKSRFDVVYTQKLGHECPRMSLASRLLSYRNPGHDETPFSGSSLSGVEARICSERPNTVKTGRMEENALQKTVSELLRTSSGSDLYRAIFRTDSPEEVVRAMPPQSVYLAVQSHGLESSLEMLQILPAAHYRMFLDFSLWEKDSFVEEAFWRWLEVIDQEDSLEPLEQFVRYADERLIARVIGGHVHAIIGEEKAEAPPSEGYFTPDQGYTWVSILAQNQDRGRRLARLLALIYQHNPPQFYQLLNISSAASGPELEEEAFQEKSRRLSDHGLPDVETIARLHASLDRGGLKRLLDKGERPQLSVRPGFVPAMLTGRLEPLGTALSAIARDDSKRGEIEAEMSLLVNAAILRAPTGMSDLQNVSEQIAFVRGTVNIGLECALETCQKAPEEIVATIGLQPLYRAGLEELRELKRLVRSSLSAPGFVPEGDVAHLSEAILSGDFPMLPCPGKVDIELASHAARLAEEDRVESSESDVRARSQTGAPRPTRPFEHLSEVQEARSIFEALPLLN